MKTSLKDTLRFLRYNIQHYSLALWGLRLRLDPDYPLLTRFFYPLILDSVFEYRTYGLHALWAILIVRFLPVPVVLAFVIFWFGISFHRSQYFESNFAFWKQVAREGKMRGRTRYVEQVLLRIEKRLKAGETWGEVEDDLQEAERWMQGIVSGEGRENNPARLLRLTKP